MAALAGGGAYFAAQLRQLAEAENEQSVIEALWSLTWAGPGHQRHVRARPAADRRRVAGAPHGAKDSARAAVPRSARVPRMSSPPRPPAIGGRWSLLATPEPDPTLRATAAASLLLDRYGVVTRGSVQAEGLPGGFAQAYRVLAGFEQAGHCRRGLRDREARRSAVRGIRHGRSAPRVRRAPRSAAASRGDPGGDRSGEPLWRCAAVACAGGRHASARAQGGRPRRADRRCDSPFISSAVASPRWRSPKTRPGSRPPPSTSSPPRVRDTSPLSRSSR